jgi:hypothetical protein
MSELSRCAGHYKCPGSSQTTGPSHLRLSAENINGLQNAPGDEGRVSVRVLCNKFPDRNEVTERPRRPNDFHRGAFFSVVFPQDFSQVATLSWLTPCPALSSHQVATPPG